MMWGWWSGVAAAFCGHYVGPVGEDLYNHASEVVITRQDGRTTMTFKNEFEGEASDFAVLVPVPVIVGAEDVHTADPALFDRLHEYTGPRLVEYDCGGYWGGTGGYYYFYTGSYYYSSGTVQVHDHFFVGSYEIVVLSAEESTGLLTWLDQHGFATSSQARDLLQEYIDAGSYFFAAKVVLDEAADEPAFLEPLQIGYDYPGFGLPIRLGTLNAGGCRQDLLLYFLTPSADGAVRITNLPEVQIPNECIWSTSDFASVDDLYEYEVDTTFAAQPGPAWATEYAWNSGGCDPCPTTPLTDEEVRGLGFVGSTYDSFTTRLHLRYDPDQVTEELMFETTGSQTVRQLRYIEDDPGQARTYPVCGRGWRQEPTDCDGAPQPPGGPGPYLDQLPPAPEPETECPLPILDPPSGDLPVQGEEPTGGFAGSGGCGCLGTSGGGAASALLLLGVWRRRRTRRA